MQTGENTSEKSDYIYPTYIKMLNYRNQAINVIGKDNLIFKSARQIWS